MGEREIKIWAWGAYGVAAREAVEILERENPGRAKISVEEMYANEIREKLGNGYENGGINELADIVLVNDVDLKGYVKDYEGLFVVMDEYMDPKGYMPYKVSNVTDDGRIYGVPYSSEAEMMFYRKDIVDRLGIEISEEPTWGEMIVAKEKWTIVKKIDTKIEKK